MSYAVIARSWGITFNELCCYSEILDWLSPETVMILRGVPMTWSWGGNEILYWNHQDRINDRHVIKYVQEKAQ